MAWTIPTPEEFSPFGVTWTDQIRLALIERADAVGWTVPVEYQTATPTEIPTHEYMRGLENLITAIATGWDSQAWWVELGGTAPNGYYGWAKDITFDTGDWSRIDLMADAVSEFGDPATHHPNGSEWISVTMLGPGELVYGGIDYRWWAFWKTALNLMTVLVPWSNRVSDLLTLEKEYQAGESTLPGVWSDSPAPFPDLAHASCAMREIQYKDRVQNPVDDEYKIISRSRFSLYDTGFAKDIHAYALVDQPSEQGGPGDNTAFDPQSSSYTDGSIVRFIHDAAVAANATETSWSALGAAVPNGPGDIGWEATAEDVLFDFSSTFTYV